MSTKDTLYNDSLFNHNMSVEFTELAYPGRNRPILNDYALLYAKGTPDVYGLMANAEYSATDPTILTIPLETLCYDCLVCLIAPSSLALLSSIMLMN